MNNKKTNTNNKDKNTGKGTFQKKKPNFVKVQLPIAYSDFYADCVDSLYDLLDSITFDKVAVPVKMARSEITGDRTAKGSIVIGSVVKFNNDNTFTISMIDDNAKYITDKCVVSCKCRKDFKANEITYISEFNISERFESMEDHEKDLEDAFTPGEGDSVKEEDVEISEATTEATE